MRIQLEPSDYLAANVLQARRTYATLMVVGLLFAVVGAARLLSPAQDGGELGHTLLWAGCGCLIVLLWSRFVILPRRTRRIYRQQKALQRPFDMDWSGGALNVTTEIGSNMVPSSDLLKWREGRRVFPLYLSEVMFYIVPKRAFPDDAAIDAFRMVLREKIST